jgi:predicted phage terminase large subunit-like protein
MITPRDVLHQAYRRDLMSFIHRSFHIVVPERDFVPAWHLEVIARALELVVSGEITRLIVTLPPRSLKSHCCSVALPAWILGLDPSARVFAASYGTDLATKFGRDTRRIMLSDMYRAVFPLTRLDPRKMSELELQTTKMGSRLATSVGGPLTGRGGDYMIIDDPLKATDATSAVHRAQVMEWLINTALSRLDNKKTGRIIVVMQRLHTDDLVGHLVAKEAGWVHLNFPAIATEDQWFDLGNGRCVGRKTGEALDPVREPIQVIETLRRTLGTHIFEAQYQQNPMPLEGGMINWSWFKTYRDPPERRPGDFTMQSWDTASKGSEVHDHSVCTTWLRRGEDHYLLDVRRERLEYPELRKLVFSLAREQTADIVLIEDKASGTQLAQELRSARPTRVEAIIPDGDKTTRMYLQTAKIEAGRVFLPAAAPWLDDFRREILQFPDGRDWDQIDSVSQYLKWESPVPIDLNDACFFGTSTVVDEWGPPESTDSPDAPWNVFGNG